MTEKEYYYNIELLALLEDMAKIIPGIPVNNCRYLMRCIDSLKERLDNMFDGERIEIETE